MEYHDVNLDRNPMLHADIVSEHECNGELIDVSERNRVYLHSRLQLGQDCDAGDEVWRSDLATWLYEVG
jgi:hypothetical protein